MEHNVAKYCNRRSDSYNAGIWPWSPDNSVFQLNEAGFTQGTKDGQGFDSDYNSRNTLFQYNYSHDNQGGFMLLCTPVARDERENIGNTGTVVRWNVSRSDHNRTFNLSGASQVKVEESVIYIGPGDDVQLVLISPWDGWSTDALFQNNKFYVEGTARYGHSTKRHNDGTYEIAPGWGPATNIRFEKNVYAGENHVDAPPGFNPSGLHATIPTWVGGEPQFDPSNPVEFPAFMERHREWMLRMLAHELGRSVELSRD